MMRLSAGLGLILSVGVLQAQPMLPPVPAPQGFNVNAKANDNGGGLLAGIRAGGQNVQQGLAAPVKVVVNAQGQNGGQNAGQNGANGGVKVVVNAQGQNGGQNAGQNGGQNAGQN